MNNNHSHLIIEENNKLIILSMSQTRYLGWHQDENGNIVDEIDENQIEISYRQDDESGWGIGGDEFITTTDIKMMADGVRSVINKGKTKFDYTCQGHRQEDLIRLFIEYSNATDTYTFTLGLLETFERKYLISITKLGLSRKELDAYIQPIFEWEKQFPIVFGDSH